MVHCEDSMHLYLPPYTDMSRYVVMLLFLCRRRIGDSPSQWRIAIQRCRRIFIATRSR